jgi:hypothetical protein
LKRVIGDDSLLVPISKQAQQPFQLHEPSPIVTPERALHAFKLPHEPFPIVIEYESEQALFPVQDLSPIVDE